MAQQRSLHLAIEKLEAGTKAARLRELMPEIERRLAAGTRISDVVQALNDNGLPISTATLKSYLYRFRKAARESETASPLAFAKSADHDVPASNTPSDSGGGISPTPPPDTATTTPGLLRHINTARCLRMLRRGAPFSRAELARELGLTRATIGHAIRELIASGLVIETVERTEGGRLGRPGSGLCLNPEGAYAIGIDISSISLTGVLVDLGMRVVHRVHAPMGPHLGDVQQAVAQIAQFPARLLAASGIDPKRVYGVCVSVPGLVDQSGRVVVAPFLRWRDVPLKQLLSARPELPWPITVCNDAVAFANAERASASERDAQNMLLILLTEGLGGAIVQRGQIFEGAHGYAGELGAHGNGRNAEHDRDTDVRIACWIRALSPVPSRRSATRGGFGIAGEQRRRRRYAGPHEDVRRVGGSACDGNLEPCLSARPRENRAWRSAKCALSPDSASSEETAVRESAARLSHPTAADHTLRRRWRCYRRGVGCARSDFLVAAD